MKLETQEQRAARKALWIARCTAHFDNPKIRNEASDKFEAENPIVTN